jgi:hypothetical protein
MKNSVISDALDFGICEFLNAKGGRRSVEFSSFFVVVVRLLCIIYGEDDITGPYLMKDRNAFDINICKYGFDKDKLKDFKEQLDKAYHYEEKNGVNPYFENIQKILIDLLMLRKEFIGVDEATVNRFYRLLYTNDCLSLIQISYKYLNETGNYNIEGYFNEELKKHEITEVDKTKVFLNLEVYPIFGVSIEKIKTLDGNELDTLNKKIYDYYGIKDSTLNKDYIVEQELEKYKKEHNKIEEVNGYIDTLLVVSIIGILVVFGLIIKFFAF